MTNLLLLLGVGTYNLVGHWNLKYSNTRSLGLYKNKSSLKIGMCNPALEIRNMKEIIDTRLYGVIGKLLEHYRRYEGSRRALRVIKLRLLLRIGSVMERLS